MTVVRLATPDGGCRQEDKRQMEFLAGSSALVASRNLSVDQSHLASPFLGRKPRHTNQFAAPGLAGGNGNGTVRQLQKFREEFDAALIGMLSTGGEARETLSAFASSPGIAFSFAAGCT